MRRTVLTLALGLAALLSGLGIGATASAAPSMAPSAIDGSITRAEIIERAQHWVDRRPAADTSGAASDGGDAGLAPDPAGSRLYRRDCAGLVAMAWHTGADHWTGTLPAVSTPVRRADLAPGDILLDAAGAVLLFDRWDGDRTHFSYYTFGVTGAKRVEGASLAQPTLDGRPTATFEARRYVRVTT